MLIPTAGVIVMVNAAYAEEAHKVTPNVVYLYDIRAAIMIGGASAAIGGVSSSSADDDETAVSGDSFAVGGASSAICGASCSASSAIGCARGARFGSLGLAFCIVGQRSDNRCSACCRMGRPSRVVTGWLVDLVEQSQAGLLI